MRYLPLVWAAVMRKPARAILTLLSVVMAFTLFGLTIGLNATFNAIAETSRADRIYVNPRFGDPLPTAMGRQISAIPGVAQTAAVGALFGYHQEKKNNVFVMMVDGDMRKVRPDWPLSAAQWDMISITAPASSSKPPMGPTRRYLGAPAAISAPAAPCIVKADRDQQLDPACSGGFSEDLAGLADGYMMGNFDTPNKARPAADQGKADWLEVLWRTIRTSPAFAEAGKRVVARFANSATPTQTITEKAANQASGSGLI